MKWRYIKAYCMYVYVCKYDPFEFEGPKTTRWTKKNKTKQCLRNGEMPERVSEYKYNLLKFNVNNK